MRNLIRSFPQLLISTYFGTNSILEILVKQNMSYSEDDIKLDDDGKVEEEIDLENGILEDDILEDDIIEEDDDFLKDEKIEEDEEDTSMIHDDFI